MCVFMPFSIIQDINFHVRRIIINHGSDCTSSTGMRLMEEGERQSGMEMLNPDSVSQSTAA